MNPNKLTECQRNALEAIINGGLTRSDMHWFSKAQSRLFNATTINRLKSAGLCVTHGPMQAEKCYPTPKGQQVFNAMIQAVSSG